MKCLRQLAANHTYVLIFAHYILMRNEQKKQHQKKKQQHESTKIVTEMCPCPSPLFAHVVRKQTHTHTHAGRQANRRTLTHQYRRRHANKQAPTHAHTHTKGEGDDSRQTSSSLAGTDSCQVPELVVNKSIKSTFVISVAVHGTATPPLSRPSSCGASAQVAKEANSFACACMSVCVCVCACGAWQTQSQFKNCSNITAKYQVDYDNYLRSTTDRT